MVPRLTKLKTVLIALVTLASCSGRTEPGSDISIADAAAAQDLTEGGEFDFELADTPAASDAATSANSNLIAMLGDGIRRFPGNAAIGPFRLGMSMRQIEANATARTDVEAMSANFSGDRSVDCSPSDGSGHAPLTFEAIPDRVEMTTKSIDSYEVDFIDDAGHPRVSGVSWSPHAKAFTMATWADYLSRTFGPPTFHSGDTDDATWQWCSLGERACSGGRDTRLPSLMATAQPDQDAFTLTLSPGKDIDDAQNLIARKPDSGNSGPAASCPRKITDGESAMVTAYLNSLLDPMPYEPPTVFRRSLLPDSLQTTLLYRLGAPEWLRKLGNRFIARYDVGYNRDPASYTETKYVAFEPRSDGSWQAVWQGDGKQLRDRYFSSGEQPARNSARAAAPVR